MKALGSDIVYRFCGQQMAFLKTFIIARFSIFKAPRWLVTFVLMFACMWIISGFKVMCIVGGSAFVFWWLMCLNIEADIIRGY